MCINRYIPYKTNVRMDIFSIDGSIVKAVINEKYGPGNHKIRWDEKDSG